MNIKIKPFRLSWNFYLVKVILIFIPFIGFAFGSKIHQYSEIFQKGLKLYEQGKYHEAIIFMDSTLKLKPGYVKALFIRGRSYLELHEYYRALDDFLETTNIDPHNPEYYYYTARCEWRLGRPKTAIETLEKVLEYDPNHPEAYQTLGDLYFELKMFNKAKYYFDKALSLNPKLNLHSKTGHKDKNTDDYQFALHEFTEEIKQNPTKPLPYFNRGLLHELAGKNHEAIKDFDRCLELDSTFVIVLYYKAQIHKKLGNIDMADKEIEHYLRYFTEDKKALALAQEIRKLKGKK